METLEKNQTISNIIINVVKPVSLKYSLPVSTVAPEDLAFMIEKQISFRKIKEYCVNRFEEYDTVQNLLEKGYSKQFLRDLDRLELSVM